MSPAGRPEIGQPINIRLGDALLDAVDNYAADHEVSRAEAIRILLADQLLPTADDLKTRREYAVAWRADNGNVCTIRTPNTPTVLREYAEKDAEAMRSPEDETEIFVAYRDMPDWQPLADGPKSANYPPNTKCVCGDLIHPDQPFVEVEADGGLFHWNADGGGHRADVEL